MSLLCSHDTSSVSMGRRFWLPSHSSARIISEYDETRRTDIRIIFSRMVEEAVRAVLEKRPPLPFLRAGLTAQDIFYSQVSGIEDALPSLLACQTDHLGNIDSPVEKLGIVVIVGTIIEVENH